MNLTRHQCFICLLLLCFSFTAHAQTDAGVVIGEITVNKKYSADAARTALENGTAELVVTSGTALVYNPRKTRTFKKKYGVGYDVLGDTVDGTPQERCLFNYVIFAWLDEKYGTEWVKDVRKDVVGLDRWILYQGAVPYSQCDDKPTFEGGTLNDFNIWVINHLELDESERVSGSVTVRILLSEDGEVLDVEDMGLLTYSPLTHAYMEAVKKAPRWTPASHGGAPCKVVLSIRSSIDYR